MSYLVLARKYRPQTFTDLVGQEHVTRTLTNAIKLGRIAHGYLFTGTRGVGKTTVARIFAKALNCEATEGPTLEPCGKCRSCKEIAASTSADVFEIDAASNTGVDDIRELRENVKYLPVYGRYKVYIIDEVHMLSKNAFNALLKTLEEPPPHVVFVFATTEAHKIPDTVLSRTQQYEFKMISLAAIGAYLKKLMQLEKVKVSDDVLMLVARKASGSVRDGLSYMDQVLSYGPDNKLTDIADMLGVVDRQALLDISAAVLAADPPALLDVLERFGASNWDVKDFLADLLEHFRNLVAMKLARNPEGLIDAGAAELKALGAQVKPLTSETLEHLFALLAESEELILRSGQPRLVLEMALVRMAQGAKVTSLDNLVDQLIEMKSAPPTGDGGGGAPQATPYRQPAQPAGKTQQHRPPAQPKPQPTASQPATDPAIEPRGAFLQAVKKQRPAVAATLSKQRIELANDNLNIHLPPGFVFNSIEAETSQLTAIATELFGRDITLRLFEAADAASPAAKLKREMEARKEDDRRKRALEQEMLTHPAVKMVLDVFPETDVKVKPIQTSEKQ